MSIYCDLEDYTIEDQLMDLFIDQLHDFADAYQENRALHTTSDFYWSSSSAE